MILTIKYDKSVKERRGILRKTNTFMTFCQNALMKQKSMIERRYREGKEGWIYAERNNESDQIRVLELGKTT